MTNFSEVLRSLTAYDPRANISLLKGAVKEQLHETDSRVQVDLTDHFNHAFVPDLILSWPGVKENRRMFLRTAYREDDLARDIDVLGDDRPILMSLDRLPDVEAPGEQLSAQAKRANSLVTDPFGLETLDTAAQTKPVISLFNHAILQGGRGVVSSSTAQASSSSVDAGFDGAMGGDATATLAAVETATNVLDSQRSNQIGRLLHAVWVGSGLPGTSFPGSARLTAVLDAEYLRFVLDLPNIEDDEFWVRLGSGLTTGRLCELRNYSATENLQKLLRGSGHRLEAKACRVLDDGTSRKSPNWSIVNGNLVLSMTKTALHFAPHALSELPQPSGTAPESNIRQLQRRARESEIRLGEVRLSNGSHSIAFSSEEEADIAHAEDLVALEAVLNNAALVAAAALVGSKEVKCNFVTRTVCGNGPARFLISELTGITVPLMVAPPAKVAREVQDVFYTREVTDVGQMEQRRTQALDVGPSEVNGETGGLPSGE